MIVLAGHLCFLISHRRGVKLRLILGHGALPCIIEVRPMRMAL